MTEFFRFRSVEKLLDSQFQELERQSLFFASPEQLNDPWKAIVRSSGRAIGSSGPISSGITCIALSTRFTRRWFMLYSTR
jgi:hypothetical protein